MHIHVHGHRRFHEAAYYDRRRLLAQPARVARPHRRSLVSEYQGRVVKGTGAGFFAAFVDPTLAVECGIAIQRRLDEHRRRHGFAPSVRIGLHMGAAMTIEDDYAAKDVVIAARVGTLASSDQILISADLADQIPETIPTRDRHPVSLKGIPNEIPVATVDWR